MKKWQIIMLIIVFSCIALFSILPFIDKRFQYWEYFTYKPDPVIVIQNETNETQPYFYENFTPPVNSFGMGETTFKTVNPIFLKEFIKNSVSWNLTYKRYSYSEWADGSNYLTINKSFNETGLFWKYDLLLDVPVDIYTAKFTFICNRTILNFVERSNSEIWVNYSIPNTNETYKLMFNWSDIKNIPGLIFEKNISNDIFKFSFQKFDISAGYYVFDPWFGSQDASTGSTNLADDDDIFGLRCYLSDNNAVIDNMSIMMAVGAGNPGGERLLIYDYDDLSFVAQTNELDIADGVQKWRKFTFAEKPTLNSGWYVLAIHGDCDVGNRLVVTVVSSTGRIVDNDCGSAYANYPDPMTNDTYFSGSGIKIYANYTVGGGWQQEISSWHTWGNISTNNLEISSWHTWGNISTNNLELSSYHTWGNVSVGRSWQQEISSWHTWGNVSTNNLEISSWHTWGNISTHSLEISSWHTWGNERTFQIAFSSYHTWGHVIPITINLTNETPGNTTNVYINKSNVAIESAHPIFNLAITRTSGNGSLLDTHIYFDGTLIFSNYSYGNGTLTLNLFDYWYGSMEYENTYSWAVNCTDNTTFVNETYSFNIEGGILLEIGINTNDLIFGALWVIILVLLFVGETINRKQYLGRGLAFFMLFIISLFGGVYIAQLYPWFFSFVMLTICGFYSLRAFLNLAKAKRSTG